MDYQALKDQNRILNQEEARLGLTRLKSKPLYFWFDIHGPCNLKCAHCGFQKYGRTSEEEVSEEVYASVMSELMPTAYVCNLGGTNWGEMTISKHFHRFLLDAKKHQVKINLTTNGTRMWDEWFDDLCDTLTVIGFSMEGIEGEFEKLRGFKWKHFLKNVEKVCQGRSDKGKSFRIEWRYCAHADSIHQLPAMIRLAKSVGVDRIQVMNLVPYVESQKYKALGYHRSLANQYFRESRQIARELNFDIEIPRDFNTGDFQGTPLLQIERKKADAAPVAPIFTGVELVNCYRPWQATVVGEIGDVRPCCVYWKPMGNLRHKGFEAVWNGRKYRQLRDSVNEHSDGICYSCRLPQFDSEQNRAASQLSSSLRELVKQGAERLWTKPQVHYAGVLDDQLDPGGVITI